jgi:CspA family cold shock protein
MPKGIIKWFHDKKGYGLIANEEGGDVFVHYSAVQTYGFKTFSEGDRVQFEIEKDTRGLKATNVIKI